jgi:hypothetical protein
LNRLVNWALRIERRRIQRLQTLPIGGSCLAVARKEGP